MRKWADEMFALGYRLRLWSLRDRNWDNPRVQSFMAGLLVHPAAKLKNDRQSARVIQALQEGDRALGRSSLRVAAKAHTAALTDAYELGRADAAKAFADRANKIGGFPMYQKFRKGQYDDEIKDGYEALIYFREIGQKGGQRMNTLYFLAQALRVRERGSERALEMMRDSALLAIEANNDHRIGGAFYEMGYIQEAS